MLASGEQKLECIWFVTYIYDPEAQAHLNLDCTLLVNVLLYWVRHVYNG
jgi:hypothetical protein